MNEKELIVISVGISQIIIEEKVKYGLEIESPNTKRLNDLTIAIMKIAHVLQLFC